MKSTKTANRLDEMIEELRERFPHLTWKPFLDRMSRMSNQHQTAESMSVMSALDQLTAQESDWTFVASTLYSVNLYAEVSDTRHIPAYEHFSLLIKQIFF